MSILRVSINNKPLVLNKIIQLGNTAIDQLVQFATKLIKLKSVVIHVDNSLGIMMVLKMVMYAIAHASKKPNRFTNL